MIVFICLHLVRKKRIDVAIRNIICCNGLVFVLTTMDEIWVQKEGYVFIPCVYGKKCLGKLLQIIRKIYFWPIVQKFIFD